MKPVDAATIRRMRANLVGDPDHSGRDLARRLAQQADSWFESLGATLPAGWALMATGGYARGVLCPGSDIDVILIHPHKAKDADVKALAESLWYPMWDAGIKLSPAVHSPKSLMSLASTDLESATTILRVRTLAGDKAAVADVNQQALDQWRRKPLQWLERLDESGQARWLRFGDVASLLEPDLKDGRGGLRDYDMLRWAIATDRPEVGAALEGPIEDLAGPADVLLAARCELHRTTMRTSNVLLLQDQDRVAESMGMADADSLMHSISAAAHAIEWATDRFWRRIRRLGGASGGLRNGSSVATGVIVHDGEAHIATDAEVDDPSYVFHLAASAAHAALPVSAGSLRMLASRGAEPGEQWSGRTRRAFLSLLGSGPELVGAVEALERYDLFSRYLPEWRRVRSLPQRNAFHTFTVDRHLLQTVANANELVRDVSRPDLLLCAALLHDIGKGSPGDHTEVGIEMLSAIAARMGLTDADTAMVRSLIEHHLLLSETATRRDLGDPRTIANVADALNDPLTLDLLAALTRADSLATGPSAWSSWKEGLINELVDRVHRALASDGDGPIVQTQRDASVYAELIDTVRTTGGIHTQHAVVGELDVLRIASADRSGLFATITGVLTLAGLDVVGADAYTSPDGTAVDEFTFANAPQNSAVWGRVESDLRGALAGDIDIDARLAQRIASQSRRKASAAAPPRLEVLVSNDASDSTTMIDVRAPDGPAVLYRLSHQLAGDGLNILSAKVVTLGHEVVDVFYVQTADGRQVPPIDHDRCRANLKAALAPSS